MQLPDRASLALDVRVRIGVGVETTLAVGFPAKGTRFVDHRGRRVSPGVSLSLEDAMSLRAEAFGYPIDHQVDVVVRVEAPDVRPGSAKSWFKLHPTDNERQVLQLRAIQPEIEHLFSLSRDLDANLRMHVEPHGLVAQQEPLYVQRYERTLKPSVDRQTIQVSASSATNVRSTEKIRVEARHLATLDSEPERLAAADGPGLWRFTPARHARGPWLVTAWQGSRSIARPLLMTVRDEETTLPMPHSESRLVSAMCSAERYRPIAIKEALIVLVDDPGDEAIFSACLSTLETLPLETLDVLAIVPEVPRLLVRALLDSDHAHLLWRRFPATRFLWECLPLSAWEDEVQRYSRQLRMNLRPELCARHLARSGARLRAMLDDCGTLMSAHYEFLFETSPEMFPRLSNPTIVEAARTPANRPMLIDQLQEPWRAACERHQTNDWVTIRDDLGGKPPPETLLDEASRRKSDPSLWQCLPIAPGCGFRRPLAYAPLVAALLATGASASGPTTIDWLKRLKRFDTAWFEVAYPFFLALCGAHNDR